MQRELLTYHLRIFVHARSFSFFVCSMNVQLLVFLFDAVFQLCLCILITLITRLRENLLCNILRGHLETDLMWKGPCSK